MYLYHLTLDNLEEIFTVMNFKNYLLNNTLCNMDVRWKLQYMFKYDLVFDSCDKQKKIYRMICIEYQLEIAEVSR